MLQKFGSQLTLAVLQYFIALKIAQNTSLQPVAVQPLHHLQKAMAMNKIASKSSVPGSLDEIGFLGNRSSHQIVFLMGRNLIKHHSLCKRQKHAAPNLNWSLTWKMLATLPGTLDGISHNSPLRLTARLKG